MALELEICIVPSCDGLQLKDSTGLYDAETDPGGYGAENGVTGPNDFDTYVASVWLPGQDASGAPQVVLNLLPAPEPSWCPCCGCEDQEPTEECYTWDFTLAQLLTETLPYGFARIEVVGTKDGDEYTATVGPLFLGDLKERLDQAMLRFDPSCPCKKGCENPLELYTALRAVECGGICDAEKTERILTYIDNNIKNCC